ncbi:O-antigen ligase [Sphingomonas sp. F9_3S_D5_B_2]
MDKRTNFAVIAALLVLALAVGGAGASFPILEMILDLAALAVAGAFAWYPQGQRLPALSRCAVALVAAAFILPLLQLVPLPPSLWQSLPGRELPAQIDAGLGISIWRPLTLDVEGTIRAVLSLIPAAVLFLGCLRLSSAERARLLPIIGGFAVVNAILGVMQLATGGSMTPYPSSHIGYPIGLFVNRNHTAVFLLLSMPIFAGLGAARAQRSSSKLPYIAATIAALTILAVVVIATTSRMALLLLPLALAGSLLVLFFRQSIWRIAVPSTLALAALGATISWVGGFNRNLARFSSLHDSRFDYWDDVYWALHHYGLAGTGFGTFVPVYQTAESLAGISPAILNHAHNDYIEILLEGGLLGVALLVGFFAILTVATVRLVRKRVELGRALLTLSAVLGIVLILIFSLVDYPLRMPAISCVFAVLCACLLPGRSEGQGSAVVTRRGSTHGIARARSYARTGGALAAITVAGVFTVQAGASSAALANDDHESAYGWAPWSTAAHDAAATELLARSQPVGAMDEALKTASLSPIDVGAVRTAAVVRTLQGSTAQGERLMQMAVTLGWRDPFTQLWAIEASERTHEPDKAIERAEALYQQEIMLPSSIVLLLQDAPDGPTARALARTLAERPLWRANFVKATAQLPAPSVEKLRLFVAKLNAGPAPLSVEEAKPLMERLVAANQIDGARALWSQVHGRALVANGAFEQVSGRSGADVPTDWDISDEDMATIAIQKPDFAGHGRALRISSAARTGPLLSQRLMLAPGTYVLSYRARSGAGQGMVLRWELRCSGSDANEDWEAAPASSSAWQAFTANLHVPVQDCPIQTLALQRPNGINAREIWVDDVTLSKPTN